MANPAFDLLHEVVWGVVLPPAVPERAELEVLRVFFAFISVFERTTRLSLAGG